MRKKRKLEKKRECSKEIANTLGKYVISMTRPIYLRRNKFDRRPKPFLERVKRKNDR